MLCYVSVLSSYVQNLLVFTVFSVICNVCEDIFCSLTLPVFPLAAFSVEKLVVKNFISELVSNFFNTMDPYKSCKL